jgi:pimeloyl-CoA synthetase
MNVQIHHVIDDITGVTGMAIVDAIVAGQRDAQELAKLRNRHIKASEETLRKALEGQLAAGTYIHAAAVAADVAPLPGADRGLR